MITAMGLLPVAIIVSLFSVHYGLAVVLGWLVLLAFNLERRILELSLLPPFAVLALSQFLGLGVGVSLIISESEGDFNPSFLKMQLIWIIGFPFFYLSYSVVFKKIRAVVVPAVSNAQQELAWRPLYYIGWILLAVRIVGYIYGAYTGSEDRGEFSVVNTSDAAFGMWTIFQLVPRFSNVGFFLLPVLLGRGDFLQKTLLGLMLGVYFLLAFVSGGRGNVIYPVIFIFMGYYAFWRLPRVPWDLAALGMAAATLPLIFFMGTYRGTEGFVSSQMIDVKSRLAAVGQTRELMRQEANKGGAGGGTVTGTALIGVNDHLIYSATPEVVPHAGLEGVQAVPLVWVPTFFMRNKPNLIDGNFIVGQYVDYEIGRGTGSTISLPADLYRRFGWLGVGLGMPIAMLAYGALTYFCYSVYLRRNFVMGTILILYTISFFTWSPLQTMLTTWWSFAYDFPRHLIVLFGLYIMTSMLSGARGIHGALHYWPMVRR